MIVSSLCLPPTEDNLSTITTSPIDLIFWLKYSNFPNAGGKVIFSGEVRNHNEGKRVSHLDYEAEIKMSEKLIRRITNEAVKKWDLAFALCIHRIGAIQISESAVLVITSHSHRKEAYEANQYIIDRVKHEVPIWKKEFYEDGTYSWGPQCQC